ncbi:hypothetical protein SAMN04490193_5128 [Pseudomonas marginalis]|nr:hypothetical protein SAMN04490193_5128 [Pseudomonas marginalis]
MIMLFGRPGLLVLLLVEQAQTAPIGALTFRPTFFGISPRSACTLVRARHAQRLLISLYTGEKVINSRTVGQRFDSWGLQLAHLSLVVWGRSVTALRGHSQLRYMSVDGR